MKGSKKCLKGQGNLYIIELEEADQHCIMKESER